jgi:manganese/zinc/iron transport system permease protein
MIGLLIAPAIAARQWTRRLEQMVILAALFGAFAGSGGAILSASQADMPTGPLMIVLAFGLVIFSLMFAPERGLLWAMWRGRQVGQRFSQSRKARTKISPAPGGLD